MIDDVPSGLLPTAASGDGWTCGIAGQRLTCTRGDALAAGALLDQSLCERLGYGGERRGTPRASTAAATATTCDNTASDPTTVTPATIT